MTPTELKSQIAALVFSYTGGLDESAMKSLLDNIVDSMGTATSLDVAEVPKIANFTAAETDKTKLYIINSSSAITITLPTGITAGVWWEFLRVGTGAVTFVAGSGATIISADNRLKIRSQYSYARAIVRAGNQFSLGGDLVL